MNHVYEVDGGFVVSVDHVWVPGFFADEATARAVTELPPSIQQALRDSVCVKEERPITALDLVDNGAVVREDTRAALAQSVRATHS